MCFSATASFSAGAFLLGLGTLTLKSAMAAKQRRALPFAAIPLLFAAQQLIPTSALFSDCQRKPHR